MSQGSLKKIEIQLLLADLALQFGNPPAGRLKLCSRRLHRRLRICACSQTGSFGLARPAPAAQRLRTASLETVPPGIQILARHLKLTRHGAHVLARQHPADDADFELPAEDTMGRFGFRFAFGHTFSYGELSLIFRVSLLGRTPGKITGNFRNFPTILVPSVRSCIDLRCDPSALRMIPCSPLEQGIRFVEQGIHLRKQRILQLCG
jgi:hypothetical protein